MSMQDIPVKELIQAALDARKKAYTPYSNFQVGAAVLTNELRIYTGCNIENAAYSPGICAERNAIYKAVSEGCRKIKAIAVVGDKCGDVITQYAYPCGVCRQVIREFSNPHEMMIVVAKNVDEYQIYTLDQLLPESFGPEHLN